MKTKSLKNRLKAVLVAFVSVLLCMGTLAMPAFAETIPTAGTDTEPVLTAAAKITKTYQWASGAAAPDETFTFNYSKVTTDAPAIAQQQIALTAANATKDATTGMMTVTGETLVIPTDTVFPHAGVYQYTVTETNKGTTGITYDPSEYTINVNVKNTETDGLAVDQITIVKDNVKYESAAFTNTYKENAGNLTISKVVTGDSGNKSDLAFSYTVTFTKASTAAGAAQTITCTKSDGTTSTVTIDADATTTTYDFTLTHGQSIVFSGMPSGTKYSVVETGTPYYTPSVTIKTNGADVPAPTATVNNSLTVPNQEIGAGVNSAAFSNAREDITITGIFTDNLPYILLVVGIIGAGAVYYTMRRRHAA